MWRRPRGAADTAPQPPGFTFSNRETPVHVHGASIGEDGYHDDERLGVGASGFVRPMASVTVDTSSRRAFTFGLSDSSPKTTATARRTATISGHLMYTRMRRASDGGGAVGMIAGTGARRTGWR